MKDQKVWYKRLWGNKAVELESYKRDTNNTDRIKRWGLEFKKKERISHAGIELSLETPNKVYHFNFYDVRHWDKEEERWLEPGEEWERYLRERAEEESVEEALEYLNKWIEQNDLEEYVESKHDTSDVREIVSDVSESNKLDVALDLFYTLLHRKVKD